MDIVGATLEERKGQTAAQLARKNSHVEVVRFIDEHTSGPYERDQGNAADMLRAWQQNVFGAKLEAVQTAAAWP